MSFHKEQIVAALESSPTPLKTKRRPSRLILDLDHGITVDLASDDKVKPSQHRSTSWPTAIRSLDLSQPASVAETSRQTLPQNHDMLEKMRPQQSFAGDLNGRINARTRQSFTAGQETSFENFQDHDAISTNTAPDDEQLSFVPMAVEYDTQEDSAAMRNFLEEETSPNNPHPALEVPPLYFMIRRFPALLQLSETIYRCRWRMSYPLQRRVILSGILKKAGVFFTWGEMLLVLPFFSGIVAGAFFSFVSPSVSYSGHATRTPMIICFITAMRNSFLTMLLGIPFERTLWYHKLSARLAYINGLLHTYVAFVYPIILQQTNTYQLSTFKGTNPNFGDFLFADQVNSGGTMLIILMTLMMVTAVPCIRHRIFEIFYYCHVVFGAAMVCCAFFHTGTLVPILAACTWGMDLFIRKVLMALCRNPKYASLRIISDSVIELSFPKREGFDYNPGQYVYVAVPELSIFEWHPFSLSSSPRQKWVTLHIRKVGNWTTSLYALAEQKSQIKVLMEGPYGSVGVDLMSDRYKMVMLFSGGIGVTPMQAICNQLMYEQSTGQRKLMKLSFIWVERDPVAMQGVDVVRCNSHPTAAQHTAKIKIKPRRQSRYSLPSIHEDVQHPLGIASALFSLVPASNVTDEELTKDYPEEEFAELTKSYTDRRKSRHLSISQFLSIRGTSDAALNPVADIEQNKEINVNQDSLGQKEYELSFKKDENLTDENYWSSINAVTYIDEIDKFDLDEESVVREAYKNGLCENSGSTNEEDLNALELQVYLTGKHDDKRLEDMPFVHFQRPDVKKLFGNMREEAILLGESRVAVCVCAPARLVELCQKACVKFSDEKVQFDFHEEVFD